MEFLRNLFAYNPGFGDTDPDQFWTQSFSNISAECSRIAAYQPFRTQHDGSTFTVSRLTRIDVEALILGSNNIVFHRKTVPFTVRLTHEDVQIAWDIANREHDDGVELVERPLEWEESYDERFRNNNASPADIRHVKEILALALAEPSFKSIKDLMTMKSKELGVADDFKWFHDAGTTFGINLFFDTITDQNLCKLLSHPKIKSITLRPLYIHMQLEKHNDRSVANSRLKLKMTGRTRHRPTPYSR